MAEISRANNKLALVEELWKKPFKIDSANLRNFIGKENAAELIDFFNSAEMKELDLLRASEDLTDIELSQYLAQDEFFVITERKLRGLASKIAKSMFPARKRTMISSIINGNRNGGLLAFNNEVQEWYKKLIVTGVSTERNGFLGRLYWLICFEMTILLDDEFDKPENTQHRKKLTSHIGDIQTSSINIHGVGAEEVEAYQKRTALINGKQNGMFDLVAGVELAENPEEEIKELFKKVKAQALFKSIPTTEIRKGRAKIILMMDEIIPRGVHIAATCLVRIVFNEKVLPKKPKVYQVNGMWVINDNVTSYDEIQLELKTFSGQLEVLNLQSDLVKNTLGKENYLKLLKLVITELNAILEPRPEDVPDLLVGLNDRDKQRIQQRKEETRKQIELLAQQKAEEQAEIKVVELDVEKNKLSPDEEKAFADILEEEDRIAEIAAGVWADEYLDEQDGKSGVADQIDIVLEKGGELKDIKKLRNEKLTKLEMFNKLGKLTVAMAFKRLKRQGKWRVVRSNRHRILESAKNGVRVPFSLHDADKVDPFILHNLIISGGYTLSDFWA